MTKSTTVASKAFVAIVAAAMVFSLVAPAAKAATAEELQAQITALMAQIASLQGGSTTTTTTTTSTCAAIPAPLTMNASGASVTALQNFLIGAGQSIPAGATGFFGAQTRSALAAWQSANGVMPAAGYYGPVTAAAIAAKCVPTTPTTPTTPGTGTPATGSLKGEASLDNFEIDSADEDELEEGDEEAPIAELTFEFTDGDASISRIDLDLTQPAGVDAFDVFETLQLWVDGKMVAEVEAGDEDDYLDEDLGTIRFSDLDIVAMEDEELEITVGATIQDGLDSDDLGNFAVEVESMRFFDADDVAETEESGFDFNSSVSFSIDEAGFEDEVLIKTSSNDPDAVTLQVEDDSKSDALTVFAFDIDTDDSTNDIEINSFQVIVDVNHPVAAATYAALVDEAELDFDGTVIDDLVGSAVATTTAAGYDQSVVLTFDVDGDVTIDAGERIEAKLMLTFKSLATNLEGATVRARVITGGGVGGTIDAEGADDIENTNISGSATGDAHTLRTTGISTEMTSNSADDTSVDGANNDTAKYEIDIEVTAFEQDVFISTNVATALAYRLVDGAGSTSVPVGSRIPVISSTADENNGYFEISEGDTETITLQVTYTPGADTSARLVLDSISFNELAAAPNQTQTTLPETDYRTALVTITD